MLFLSRDASSIDTGANVNETINTERAKDLLYENLAMQDVSEHRLHKETGCI
jgi:hypothetical protein